MASPPKKTPETSSVTKPSTSTMQLPPPIVTEMGSVRGAGIVLYRLTANMHIEYLMLQTTFGKHHWMPPKGHINLGESDRVAAERETLEETGLSPDDYTIDERCGTRELQYQAYYHALHKQVPKTVVYYVARMHDPHCQVKLNVNEHLAFKWCSLTTAAALIPMDKVNVLEMLTNINDYLTTSTSAMG